MANLTLAIDDDLLKTAREYAQLHDTTVTAMVRDYLERTVRTVDTGNLVAFLREISLKSQREPGSTIDRYAMYEERADELEERRRRNPRLNEGG